MFLSAIILAYQDKMNDTRMGLTLKSGTDTIMEQYLNVNVSKTTSIKKGENISISTGTKLQHVFGFIDSKSSIPTNIFRCSSMCAKKTYITTFDTEGFYYLGYFEASGYGVGILYRETVTVSSDSTSSTPSLPPPPPLALQSLYSPPPQSDKFYKNSSVEVDTKYKIHNTYEHKVHIYGMIITIGTIFPFSIIMMHYATCFTHMFRKALHTWLQIIGTVTIYIISIPMIKYPDDGTSTRLYHKFFGYILLYAGIPLIFVTRLQSFKKWHKLFGRLLLVSFSVQVMLGSWVYKDTFISVLSYILLGFYILNSIYTHIFDYPSLTNFITKTEDGTYIINKCKEQVLPVGSGWSNYLNKRIHTEKQFFLRQLSGRYKNGNWGAGTSIANIQSTLRKEGKTLSSHPSVLGATVGGWIFTNSHGSGGELWKTTIGKLKVYDTNNCEIIDINNKSILFSDNKTINEQRRFIVLEAEIKSVNNVDCFRNSFYIKNIKDSKRFFEKDTLLRLIFIDSKNTVCFTWTLKQYSSYSSWLRFVFPPWLFGSKILPPICNSCINPQIWNKRTTLSEGNHFNIDPPYFTLFFAYFYTNVEYFIKVTITDEGLLILCNRLQQLLKTTGGRCDVRYQNKVLYLDFVMILKNYTYVQEFLNKYYINFTIHKGKYQI